MVVMMPLTMPQCAISTLTTGARQLVVQLALEMTLCLAASYLSSFTPRTRVTSSLVAGAEMISFFTVEPRWAFATVASVKRLVDTKTTKTTTTNQKNKTKTKNTKTKIFFPSTVM